MTTANHATTSAPLLWQTQVSQNERDGYIQQLTNTLTLLSNGVTKDDLWRVASSFEATAFNSSLSKEVYIQKLKQKVDYIKQRIKKASEVKNAGTAEAINNVTSPGGVQVEQALLASPQAAIPSGDANKAMPNMTTTTATDMASTTTTTAAAAAAAATNATAPQMPSLIPPAVSANARNTYAQLYKIILAQKAKPQILTNLSPEVDAEIREQTRQIVQVYQSLDLLIPHYIATTQTPTEIPRLINMQILLKEHIEAQPRHTLTLDALKQLRILLLRYINQVHQSIAKQWGQSATTELTASNALANANGVLNKVPAVAAAIARRPGLAAVVANPAPTRTTPAELDAVMEGVIKSPLDPKNLRLPPRKARTAGDRKERSNPLDYVSNMLKQAESKKRRLNGMISTSTAWRVGSDGLSPDHPLFLNTMTVESGLLGSIKK